MDENFILFRCVIIAVEGIYLMNVSFAFFILLFIFELLYNVQQE